MLLQCIRKAIHMYSIQYRQLFLSNWLSRGFDFSCCNNYAFLQRSVYIFRRKKTFAIHFPPFPTPNSYFLSDKLYQSCSFLFIEVDAITGITQFTTVWRKVGLYDTFYDDLYSCNSPPSPLVRSMNRESGLTINPIRGRILFPSSPQDRNKRNLPQFSFSYHRPQLRVLMAP